jgi:hypothetical protein
LFACFLPPVIQAGERAMPENSTSAQVNKTTSETTSFLVTTRENAAEPTTQVITSDIEPQMPVPEPKDLTAPALQEICNSEYGYQLTFPENWTGKFGMSMREGGAMLRALFLHYSSVNVRHLIQNTRI